MEKFTPRPAQMEDLVFMLREKKGMYLHDPGVGKTLPACLFIYALWMTHKTKTYFVMPKSLMRKNYQELLKCTNFTEHDLQILDGTPKERAIQMNNSRAKVFLMGFKRFSDDWRGLKTLQPELGAVVVDEIHMGFKSHDSQRTKELFKCMNGCEYFLAMSGTLIDGRLDSCFPTIKIIEPRYYASHGSFMAQHAIKDEYGTVLDWHNHGKIGRILKRHGVRRTFEQEYGKEDPVIQNEICEMHPKQREAYKEFEEAAILELEDGYLEGFNQGVAVIRCRQIMAHPETFGILKPGETTGKDESLIVHLEDHKARNEPFLIFSVLIPEQQRIFELCKKMGFNVGLYNSTVSTAQRDIYNQQFIDRKLDGIVGSPQTMAVGLNWPFVNHVIFASLGYQNSDFVQGYKRAIRGKRETPLRVTVLEYENSIDQRIFQIVNKKSLNAHKIDETNQRLTLGSKKNSK